MRRFLAIGCLALAPTLWINTAFADVQAIKERLAYAKANKEAPEDTVKAIFARAKANNEKPEDTLKDIISTEPTLAYSALTVAVNTYPSLKASLVQTAISNGLPSRLVNTVADAAIQPEAPKSKVNPNDASDRATVKLRGQQTVNTIISSPTGGNTGGGGLLQQTIFVPVGNVIIPPFNGTDNSVGGGGCGAGTVLTKNETTGVSRCASKS